MEMRNWRLLLSLAFIFLFALTLPAYGADIAPRISAEQLKDSLADTGLVLLDVRTAKDWKKSDMKITGAVRVDPIDVDSWAANYSMDQRIVLYCA